MKWTAKEIENADPELCGLLAKYLGEVDRARQALLDAGFGMTGMPIERQVDEAIQGGR